MKYTGVVVFFLSGFIVSSEVQASSNICDVFPAVAQSHTQTELGWLAVYGASYIQQKMSGPLSLGFTKDLTLHSESCHNGTQLEMCRIDPTKRVNPLPAWPLYPGRPDLSIVNGTQTLGEAGECVLNEGNNPSACAYNNLNLENGILNLHPGTYWFNDVVLSEISQLNILGPGKVRFYAKTLDLQRDALINTKVSPDNFIVMLSGSGTENQDSTFAGKSKFNAHIYATGGVIVADEVEITGAVTVENLRLSHDHAKIIGKSACFSDLVYQLEISPLKNTGNICSRLPVTFNVVDEQGFIYPYLSGSLTANVKAPGNGCWAETQTGVCTPNTKEITLTNGTETLWLQNDAGGTVNVNAAFNSSVTQGLTSKQEGVFRFLPSGFRFSPVTPSQDMVAGKDVYFNIEAINDGCHSNQALQSYEGPKELHIGEANYITPYYAFSDAPVKPVVNGSAVAQVIPVNFKKGIAEKALKIRYLDAGSLSIPVTDVTPISDGVETQGAHPSKKKGSDNAGSTEAETRTPPVGQLVLNVRPYTFAICPSNVNKGHSTQSDVFTMAGAPFSLDLKPVIWMQNDRNDSLPVALSASFCDRPYTPSFSRLDAPPSNVKIDERPILLSPALGENATLGGELVKTNTDAFQGRYLFSNLKLSEVGTFTFSSSSGALNGYLGMTINPGELTLGRFYPSHFEVSPVFTPGVPPIDDENTIGFTYLGQPFSAEYTVRAVSVDGVPLKNYHLFEDAEKATLDEWVIASGSTYPYEGQRLNDRWKLTTPGSRAWFKGTDGSSQVQMSSKMWVEKALKPDGPFYPLRFAVGILEPDRDNTAFKFCQNPDALLCNKEVKDPLTQRSGAEFGSGDFYFGLLRLKGFSETQNLSKVQTIPITTEYFENNDFRVNVRDNYSVISTTFTKKEILHSDTDIIEDQAKIILMGDTEQPVQNRPVTQGRAHFQVTPPNQDKGVNREQFIYSLLLAELSDAQFNQPWLQHHWQGDASSDNPYAVGTYGFFRGSDRIIYRGEKNIALVRE